MIRDAFYSVEQVYPRGNNIQTLNEKSKIFMQKMFESMLIDLKNEDTAIILEDSDISIEECNEIYGKNPNNLIYYLGMTEITAIELLIQIRENETEDDWTCSFGNNRLEWYCGSIIEDSKRAKQEREKYTNIKFYDTSGNRQEKLKEIISDIEKQIKYKN